MQIRFLLKKPSFQFAAGLAALMVLSGCAETEMPSSTPMHLGAAAFAPRGYLKFCERRPDQCGLPAPLAVGDRTSLEHVLNEQQWANVFNLRPTSTAPMATVRDEKTEAAAPQFDLALAKVSLDDVNSSAPILNVEDSEEPETSIPTSEPTASAAPRPDKATLVRPFIHLTPVVWAALNGVNQSVNGKIRPMSDEEAFGIADYWTLPLSEGPRAVGNCKHYALEKRKALVEAGFSAAALSIAIVRTGWGEVHAVLIVGTDQGDYVLDNLSPWIKGWRELRYEWIERQTPGEPLRWATVAGDSKTSYRTS